MMSSMSDPLTLPALDDELSRLQPGQTFPLSNIDFVRLFGTNNAALGRLRHFARGHHCTTVRAKAGVQFRKLEPAAATLVREN
jgi:hypothetical protein